MFTCAILVASVQVWGIGGKIQAMATTIMSGMYYHSYLYLIGCQELFRGRFGFCYPEIHLCRETSGVAIGH